MKDDSGFSMIELVVTLVVMVIAVLFALSLFDSSSRLTKTQVGVAQMQSAQRTAQLEMVRMVSMAGVGGLPEGIAPDVATTESIGTNGVFPNGLALAVDNNVSAGTDLGTTTDPLLVVTGTDVLTLRGVFSTPVYYVEPTLPLVLDGSGNINVNLTSQVDLGVTQNLESLRNVLSSLGSSPEAFIVYDRYNPGAFAIMEYDDGNSVLGSAGDLTMSLRLSLGSSATHASDYGRMVLGTSLAQGAGGQTWTVPGTSIDVTLPRQIGAIGLLEEYRFFVKSEREVEGVPTSRLLADLVRARFYPGTNALHPEGALDLATNMLDLQVALAVDKFPNDNLIDEIGEAADDDEILYNYPGDNDGLSAISSSEWADPEARILFVRLSTVAQADRPDPDFPGAVVNIVEDHDYSQDAPPSIFNTGNYSKLRKRLLQSIVQVRNLP